MILYRFVGSLLGASLTGDAVSELSTPLGALVVAVAVLVYHGLQLRRDQALRSEAPAVHEARAAPVEVRSGPDPAADVTVARLAVVLVGPDGSEG